MIQEAVNSFISRKEFVKYDLSKLTDGWYGYMDILKVMLSHAYPNKEWGDPDMENIHVIDDGDYQGTLLYVIPEMGYQPWRYYYVKVSYGSCSCCDLLESIRGTEEELEDLYTLALHMVEGMKEI